MIDPASTGTSDSLRGGHHTIVTRELCLRCRHAHSISMLEIRSKLFRE